MLLISGRDSLGPIKYINVIQANIPNSISMNRWRFENIFYLWQNK